MTDDEDLREYAVVRNDEERYSIWPADREPPAGWERTGFAGPKAACLAHVDEVWTDMRPRSLRERMAAAEAAPGSPRDE
jgi:MbtH protein